MRSQTTLPPSQSRTDDTMTKTDTAPQRGGATLELKGLWKKFGNVQAVAGVDLQTSAGEFVTLLGASGSGKTTTLNLVAGFLAPDAGEILLDGHLISTLPTHKRGIGMVFQDYLLFPHMTAASNVAFALKRRKVASAEITKRVGEALELVGLHGLGGRYPRELSGGQQQRVALARAIVFRPTLLLMDEPLGALDRNLREVLQLEIRRIHRELGTTFVYVTHDQEEALVLSDRIAVFNEGRIEQIASPDTIYDRPSTTFVAGFVGDSNIFRGATTKASGGQAVFTIGKWRIAAPADASLEGPSAVVVRPEKMRLDAGDTGDKFNRIEGTIVERIYLGSELKIVTNVPDLGPVVVHEAAGSHADREPGTRVEISWRRADSVVVADTQ